MGGKKLVTVKAETRHIKKHVSDSAGFALQPGTSPSPSASAVHRLSTDFKLAKANVAQVQSRNKTAIQRQKKGKKKA